MSTDTVRDIPVIAIDGPSGSGKGTVAGLVARELGWHLLDSGALYRLVGLAASKNQLNPDNGVALARLAAGLQIRFATAENGDELIFLDGDDVSGTIRTEESGRLASQVAKVPELREALIGVQRGFRQAPGLVADGRDMGTRIFVDAGLKVFLTASPAERARRRHKQLKDKGIDVSLPALSRDIESRDRQDTERSVAPLQPAQDARTLDSSDLSIDQVVQTIIGWAKDIDLVT